MFTTEESSSSHSSTKQPWHGPQDSQPSPTSEKASVPPSHDLSSDARRIVEAAIAILAQGEELLRTLPQGSYVQRIPQAFNGSIGGHYRHCLDHFTSLLRSLDADVVDYDHRARDVRVESEPDFALALTQQLRATLEQMPLEALHSSVLARCEVSYAEEESPVTRSSFGREMVYAIAHAIHHYAIISLMAQLLGATLPEHFGIAPSTVAHHSKESGR